MTNTKIFLLALGTSFLSLNAQIPKKVMEKGLPACKTMAEVTTKGQTQLKTIYTVDKYYTKFEDGMYAEFNTDSGRIIVKLHFDKVPLTVCNFVGLAEGTMPNEARAYGKPYYDSLKFHRVISKANGDGQDFMVQGGDPKGTGEGGPGYDFEDEFHPDLLHTDPGILSMANAGPGTNGSQFFITIAPTPWLDNKHSVFGKVVEGQDVVNKIRQNNSMKSVRIIRKGKAALEFKADSATFQDLRRSIKIASDFAVDDAEVLKRYPTAKKTSSGLWYVVTKEGTGAKVQKKSEVKVHYRGKLANGKEFDNSYTRNEPIGFPVGVGKVIPGWDEGIAMMSEGSEYILIIPSKLGYGSHGAGGVIPPNSTLVFETMVVSVAEPAKPSDFATKAEDVLKKYPNAKSTPSGLWYVVTEEGTGAQAAAGKTVEVHYRGTLPDGKPFDNSYDRGAPFAFVLGKGQVIQGWDEGIALMKVGAKYTLIIPSSLAYGEEGAGGGVIPPSSTIIFETELISVK